VWAAGRSTGDEGRKSAHVRPRKSLAQARARRLDDGSTTARRTPRRRYEAARREAIAAAFHDHCLKPSTFN
jgi:hypothetical protein